jgi:hypothetical protein
MFAAGQRWQRWWARMLALAGTVLLGVASGGEAYATDPAAVEALIARGVELRRAGDDVRALPLFKQAYDQAGTPRSAAQLGLVEMQLGYHAEADRHLREALASPDDFWVRKNRTALEGALADLRGRLAEIHIRGTPAGAEVLVNQRPVGRLPLDGPVRVAKGEVTIEVRAPGGKVGRRSFATTPGQSERVEFHLGEAQPAPPPEPAPARVVVPAAPEVVSPAAETRAAAPDNRGRLGAFLRMDIAVYPESGQRLAPGLSYQVNDRLEIGLAALIGKLSKGTWLGARYRLRGGALRPSLGAGIPVLVQGGSAQVGGQLSAGLTLDLGARTSLFADLGAALFPAAPAGAGRVWLLPALGVAGRL